MSRKPHSTGRRSINHNRIARPGRSRRVACAVGAAAVSAVMTSNLPRAQAANRFWDPDGVAPVNGGAGAWNTTNLNWAVDSAASGYQSWDNAAGDDAVFQGTAATVTIDAPGVSANTVTFNIAGYTLAGPGAVTLTGTAAVDSTGAATISAPIAGSSGFTKLGTGTLTLTGANTYTGTTVVGVGTMILGAAGALPSGANLSVNGGLLNAGSLTTNVASLNLNAGTITGTGTVTTSGTMTYNGTAPVSIGGASQIGVPLLFSAPVAFVVGNTGNGTMNSVIDAPGQTFTKQGGGTLNMTIVATNTYSSVTVNAGTLAIVVDRNFGVVPSTPTANAVTLNGGAIRATSNSTYIPADNRGFFIDTGGGTFDYSFSSGTVVLGATITGPGQLTKTGSTTFAATNPNNTFSGGLVVNQGRWNAQVTGSSGTGSITLAPIGTSSVNFGIGLTNTGSTPTLSNNISLVPGTGSVSFEINNSTPTQNVMTLTGQISGTSDLVKGRVAGTTGVLVVSNPANSYTGSTQVLLGTLRTGNNGAGVPSSSNLLLGGGVYESNGTITRSLGTAAGSVQLTAGAAGFSAFGAPLTVDIGGNGTGTGGGLTWGGTTFNPSTLVLNAPTATDSLTFLNNVDLGTAARTVQTSAGTAKMSGVISNTGSLTKSGAGVLVLTGNNTYTGGTSVIGGTLSVGSDANLGAAAGPVSFLNGATLRTTANVTSGRPISLGTGTLGGTIDTAGNDSSISGVVSGSGALNKTGAGTLRLTGNNTMTGPTQLAAGTIVLGKDAFAPVLTNAGGADVKQGRLVFDYSGGGVSPASQVQTILTAGRPGNFATGKIRSSTADASKGLGWTDDGASKTTVGYVYYGDTDLSGTVDLTDFTFLAGNFNGTGKVWAQGDFNYDGSVDLTDFTFLAGNFNKTLAVQSDPAGGAALGALVPEPASVTVVGMIAAGLVRRRRRA